MKIAILLQWILGGVIVLLVAILIFNSQTATAPAPELGESEASELSLYFQERLTTLGVEDIGMPIEGFNAGALRLAFPGLEPMDFEGVETFEGHYEVEGSEVVFVRDRERPITSAESTLSEKGYTTLLKNVSDRLSVRVADREDIDTLIESVNTAERISARINQGSSAFGVKVTPREVLEDSRCPIDVTCIQAGTVRIRATLESGSGTSTQEFKLDEPITTEVEEVTLVQVAPVLESGKTVTTSEYVFTFEVKKRQ